MTAKEAIDQAMRLLGKIAITDGTKQVETATVEEVEYAHLTAGTAKVIITAAGMLGSPKTLYVGLTTNDNSATVAGKIRISLLANNTIAEFFDVSGTNLDVILTAKTAAANDETMNISVADGTQQGHCEGLVSVNSVSTVAGAAIYAIDNISNPLYLGQGLGFVNSRQQELARLEGNTENPPYIEDLDDLLSLSDDTAMRILPYGLAADFARFDNASNNNLQYFLTEYEKLKRTIVYSEQNIEDQYDILNGMR